jgi:hypothetical protein
MNTTDFSQWFCLLLSDFLFFCNLIFLCNLYQYIQQILYQLIQYNGVYCRADCHLVLDMFYIRWHCLPGWIYGKNK